MITLLVVGVGLAAADLRRPDSTLGYVFLHGRVFENRIEGSDAGRIEAFTQTTQEIIEKPFGHGLGSAGPASFQAERSVIPENWYLQIAYEIGVIGLMLYICAFAFLLGDFWRHRADPLAAALFAATVGVLVTNLFLHALADSSLSLILFGLYGIYKRRAT
jgi:O-antigen ligase